MTKWIHSGAEARRIDQKAIQEIGIPSLVLMEHAASKITEALLKEYGHMASFAVLAGPGNNGADGLAVARLLQHHHKKPIVFIDETAHFSEEEAIHLQACRNLGIEIRSLEDDFSEAQVLVDALFGSGLSRNIEGKWARVIERANRSKAITVSIDVPSGLNGTTGQIMNTAAAADLVLCLDCIKTGCLIEQGPQVCKSVQVLDITIPDSLHLQSPNPIRLLDRQEAAGLLQSRPKNSHKGTFGKVLMAGGSLAMQGALDMAFQACFASGAGTVTLFAPKEAAKAIASKQDLAMMICADQNKDGTFGADAWKHLRNLLPSYTHASCGNGMGQSDAAGMVVKTLLDSPLPLVLDADGLNNIASDPALLDRNAPLILTPHVKEFSRISGFHTQEILSDPFGYAQKFLKQHPHVILVLKASWTLIASSQEGYFLDCPNSALAKGGSGDVLCGIITGLLAQNYPPLQAAALGVWLASASARQGSRCPWTWTPLKTVAHLQDAFEELLI